MEANLILKIWLNCIKSIHNILKKNNHKNENEKFKSNVFHLFPDNYEEHKM